MCVKIVANMEDYYYFVFANIPAEQVLGLLSYKITKKYHIKSDLRAKWGTDMRKFYALLIMLLF